MQLYEREFFVNRIASGYIRCKVKDSTFIYKSPNIDILYEASELYKEVYENAIEEGLFSDNDVVNILVKKNLWSEKDEVSINKTLPENIETIKLEMIDSISDRNKIEHLRKYLRVTEDKMHEMFEIRHSLDYLTCHGAATFSKMQFLLSKCVNGQINSSNIISFINKNFLTEKIVREIARTDPWRQIWSSRKLDRLFGVNAVEYSEEQKRLVGWSMLYDSVFESAECPSESVINDDDVFDGFLIKRRKKNEAEQVKNEYSEILARHENASEVFLVVNPDEIKKVSVLNDPIAKSIIENRIKTIEKFGTVKDTDFTDVKTRIAMMKNRG